MSDAHEAGEPLHASNNLGDYKPFIGIPADYTIRKGNRGEEDEFVLRHHRRSPRSTRTIASTAVAKAR